MLIGCAMVRCTFDPRSEHLFDAPVARKSTPISSHQAVLACAVSAPRRASSRRLAKKIFEVEVEVSGMASGTAHKGGALRKRQSAPSLNASTAPRKTGSSSWRAAACWKSAARVEPAARRRNGRRHGGCRCFAAARTGPHGQSVERRRVVLDPNTLMVHGPMLPISDVDKVKPMLLAASPRGVAHGRGPRLAPGLR